MHVAIYVPLLIPALAALAARPLAARLRPVVATWLLTLSALALAAASSAVLGMLALSALLRIPFVAGVGHLSDPVISRGDAVSLPVAIIAGGLLAAVAVAATRAVWWRAGAIGAAYRRARTLPGAGEIVVTEDAAADAYTIPGWPCRIVITRGMLSALAGEERGVLLSHERAHARNAHYLFTSAARLAAAANPLLRPVAGEVCYVVERWADEHAAAQAGDRKLVARAIARAALAASAAPPDRDPAIAALGLITENEQGRPAESGRRGRPGPVPRRVAALLAQPPGLSPLLLVAAAALVIVSGASAAEAARNFHQLIELAQTPRG
ncbi:M56 family peptidase [Trebonia kvetii]|uniref:M56 family peptidase n=1 Tax=Trebonia kvetii TaxID=2480626 RepID=A0A6P2BXM5_9ACTN|nr:M56 family metallopeptidase [Trebonia kvetii]TVZ02976.1 M56 family peptidase [Trebonia kvetii]